MMMNCTTSYQRLVLQPYARSVKVPWTRTISTPRSLSTAARKSQNRIPASYYRGGTSRAIMFKEHDLPKNRNEWGKIFLGVLGSPDMWVNQSKAAVYDVDINH